MVSGLSAGDGSPTRASRGSQHEPAENEQYLVRSNQRGSTAAIVFAESWRLSLSYEAAKSVMVYNYPFLASPTDFQADCARTA